MISNTINDNKQETVENREQKLKNISWSDLRQIQKLTKDIILQENQWDTWYKLLKGRKFNKFQEEITDKGVTKVINENNP